MKEQTVRILTVLVLSIIVVGTAIACLFLEPSTLNADSPYVYTPLPRRASLSLEPSVDGIGFLDGENGSQPKRIMYHAPYFYIFGETQSRERDFLRDTEGNAIFVAMVGSAGTVFSVQTFSGSSFITAKNTGEGFVILTQTSLTAISYSGEVTATATVSDAIDMYFNRGQGLAVISGKAALTLTLYSNTLASLSTTTIAREDSLSYVGIVASGTRYTLFLNTPSFPTIATVQTTASFNDLSSLEGCTLTDFVPVDGGGFLLALIDKSKNNLARAVKYQASITDVYTGGTNCNSFKIFDTENGYFFRTNLGENDASKYMVSELDRGLNLVYASRTALGEANVLVGLFYQTKRYAVIEHGSSTILRTIDGTEKDVLLADGKSPLYSTENGLIVITYTNTTNIILPNAIFLTMS